MAKNENGKLPAGLAEAFEADSGFGFEEVTSSDLQIPFLRIIQALSPQLKKSDAAFIEGAGQGDICAAQPRWRVRGRIVSGFSGGYKRCPGQRFRHGVVGQRQ